MECLMDEKIIEKNIKTIDEIYRKDEDVNYAKINSNFEDINGYYISDNTSKFKNIEFELSKKFKLLSIIHENNELVIKTAFKNYVSTRKYTERNFETE